MPWLRVVLTTWADRESWRVMWRTRVVEPLPPPLPPLPLFPPHPASTSNRLLNSPSSCSGLPYLIRLMLRYSSYTAYLRTLVENRSALVSVLRRIKGHGHALLI